MTDMTKQEMLKELRKGKKVRHQSFEKQEWMKAHYHMFIFEDDSQISPQEFWYYREDESWDTGWSIVEVESDN